MAGLVYDAGVLISMARNDASVWLRHSRALAAGVTLSIPAGVVAQAWRDGRRQALLARLLRGCDVIALDHARARRVGELLGRARSADVVDGSVVALAVELAADIVSSDPADLRTLVRRTGREIAVIRW